MMTLINSWKSATTRPRLDPPAGRMDGINMSYQIITYNPDTGVDEHGDYRTQREARQALKQYRQEAGALIYDLDRWRIVYRRGYWPTGALPIESGCNA